MTRRLIFIYNANSGAINGLIDSAHKIISPSTYDCSLCAITHGVLKENKIWADYRKTAGIAMEFLHRDEFLKQYKSKWLPAFTFPIVLLSDANGLSVFITTEVLNQVETQSALIRLVAQGI